MLPDSAGEITCYTDIKGGPVLIGHDVDITLFIENDKVWIDLRGSI